MANIKECGKHLVVGLAGPELSAGEREFLLRVSPAGVILFQRNIGEIAQLDKLILSITGSFDPPPTVWLDQEGGRVQRVRQPLTAYPSPWRLALLEERDGAAAQRLAWEAGWLNGRELAALGVGVNCAPVLDVREEGADPVIGERAFGSSPRQVVRLAGAWLKGFALSGTMAVGKHFPGHGAARADSHRTLPVVERSLEMLQNWELLPFRELLGELPALMTAHLVATGLDGEWPATWSAPILEGLLRRDWGYDGLVVSDALEMGALEGDLAERARKALVAGCDLVLCCTGRLEDGLATLEGIRAGWGELSVERRARAGERLARWLDPRRRGPTGWSALAADPVYRERRRRVESLAATLEGGDPTDGGSGPAIG